MILSYNGSPLFFLYILVTGFDIDDQNFVAYGISFKTDFEQFVTYYNILQQKLSRLFQQVKYIGHFKYISGDQPLFII